MADKTKKDARTTTKGTSAGSTLTGHPAKGVLRRATKSNAGKGGAGKGGAGKGGAAKGDAGKIGGNKAGAKKGAAKGAAKEVNMKPRRVDEAPKTLEAFGADEIDILAWENDPFAEANPSRTPVEGTPIIRPVPELNTARLPIAITGQAPPPRRYPQGTAEFRYWVAAEALARGRDFWASLLPTSVRWSVQSASTLRVALESGEDLNAYYNRSQGLRFYRAAVGGRAVYSGESPDIACHELGHAVLDAIRPQLFNAGYIEAAAFHESFGDVSAILTSLQLQSLRDKVLVESSGNLYRTSRLSRVAEQLGWAIRQVSPGAVDRDSLRNAVNPFFYQDPSLLPPNGPATILTSRPHSFSRVFTGAFFEALAGMLSVLGTPTSPKLLQVSQDAGQLLVDAVRNASIVPAYFSQVAAGMIRAEENRFNGRYRNALSSAFIRHGVLSLEAASMVAVPPEGSAMALVGTAPVASSGRDLPLVDIPVAEYILGVNELAVHASSEQVMMGVAGAAPDIGSVQPPADNQAAKSFVEDLLRLGRIDLQNQTSTGNSTGNQSPHPFDHPFTLKTHKLVKQGKGATLERVQFDCGFDCACGTGFAFASTE